jgi:signal transduction histidine kinase
VSSRGFSLHFRFVLPGLLMAGLILSAGCNSRGRWSGSGNAPVVKFTSVPLAGIDNPEKVNTIKGRVIGARPGERIVVYAYAQAAAAWWVQPFADQPFTAIQPDSTWQSLTHPGIEYAALLVGQDFQPPPTTATLPTAGVLASTTVKGGLAFWRTWWFPLVCVFVGAAIVLGLHRLRLLQISRRLNQRFEERLAERTRVAQELHDTLLQGLLSASMQLHVAVDQLPENAPGRPALNHVLQMMEQIVGEGRNTLRGLRSSIDGDYDLETSFSRVPQEIGHRREVSFRVGVAGAALPLRPVIRDEVYSIGREALVNAFRHSGAANITVELEYAARQLRIVIRDDGCGIDERVLEFGRDGHWGLSGMRERSERIGASFKVRSHPGNGTEVELRVPSKVAFESDPAGPASKVLRALYQRGAGLGQPVFKKRAG